MRAEVLPQRDQAERDLRELGRWIRRRDDIVTRAVDAGISWSEIQRETGIARTTISRILHGANG